ncbi:hypothetical protein TSAR_005239 [Trichomalopsis sarcophagae]|uniref:Uncharacterized protein n=1 Tax=Trichomalopsis sarcophagae TaxID=543379 RepID=A0A232EML6_9HYME|nr:hypothetical protein TSAR_005239 [Trichomalopsis sarcophagae]
MRVVALNQELAGMYNVAEESLRTVVLRIAGNLQANTLENVLAYITSDEDDITEYTSSENVEHTSSDEGEEEEEEETERERQNNHDARAEEAEDVPANRDSQRMANVGHLLGTCTEPIAAANNILQRLMKRAADESENIIEYAQHPCVKRRQQILDFLARPVEPEEMRYTRRSAEGLVTEHFFNQGNPRDRQINELIRRGLEGFAKYPRALKQDIMRIMYVRRAQEILSENLLADITSDEDGDDDITEYTSSENVEHTSSDEGEEEEDEEAERETSETDDTAQAGNAVAHVSVCTG